MDSAAAKLSAVAVLLAVAGCRDSKSPIDAAALLEERCGACHSTDIPKNARKSKRVWRETVTRMIDKGARLSPEEKKILINHLAKHYRL